MDSEWWWGSSRSKAFNAHVTEAKKGRDSRWSDDFAAAVTRARARVAWASNEKEAKVSMGRLTGMAG